ncbi:thioredoxin family protein [Rhodohalobacter sulfatireducens]|uniref:Thioredoxin family protein n=1 Tax=Rhodohalobacter sulfatireducens TaxID=2911366 RepID=A0ABS9KBM5_9BACT|nr:thioredoxin fold domain-containing protein [Rhodohalobacter sulfatireducens]MCG2588252.1 thioredoxin family protein [Rhodohalobacter sulfatireducens]
MKQILKYLSIAVFVLLPVVLSAQTQKVEPIPLQQALELAPQEGKKILVDVFANWCPYCQRMHSEIYPSEAVQNAISDYFLWVRIDVESDAKVNYHGEEMTEAEFASALENQNVPTAYFLNSEGAILGKQPGFLKQDLFVNLLKFVGSDAYLDQSFQDYAGEK